MNRAPLWRNAVWASNFLASEVEAVGKWDPFPSLKLTVLTAPEN